MERTPVRPSVEYILTHHYLLDFGDVMVRCKCEAGMGAWSLITMMSRPIKIGGTIFIALEELS